jgi:DNA polymerase III delta subunit
LAVDRLSGEGFTLAMLGDAVSTQPFLTTKRMVIVRDISANKQLAENIEAIASFVADTTDLVIIEPKLDNRSVYRKWLMAHAETTEFSQLDGQSLIDWLVGFATEKETRISQADAQYLIDRVGMNQQILANEVTKLALISSEIDKALIDEATSYTPQSSIFSMLDAAFSGNQKLALQLYDEQRIQGMEPQAIMGMIAWQLHILNIIAHNSQSDAQSIATGAKLSPFVVRKNLAVVRRIGPRRIIQHISSTIESDIQIKNTKVNIDNTVRNLLVSYSAL